MEKRCPKCGETKPASMFWKRVSSKDGLQSRCKTCQLAFTSGSRMTKEEAREYRLKNSDAIKQYQKKWMDANMEKVLAWRARNPDKIAEAWRKQNRRKVEQLSDCYVMRYFKMGGVDPHLVTPGLLEAKRVQIKIHRLLKEKAK